MLNKLEVIKQFYHLCNALFYIWFTCILIRRLWSFQFVELCSPRIVFQTWKWILIISRMFWMVFFFSYSHSLLFFFSNKIYTYCNSSRYINGYVGCMCALSCVKIASNTFHSFIESTKYLVLWSWVSIEPTNLMKLTRLDVLVCWIGLNCNFILRFELDRVQMNSLSNPYD